MDPENEPSVRPLIVVSGLPRSGTSLLMAMLKAGGVALVTDALRTPDEDNPNGYFELEAVKRLRSDQSWITGALGKAVKIVVPVVLSLPPSIPVRVLFLERNITEVIASQAAMLARKGVKPVLPAEKLQVVFQAQVDLAKRSLESRPSCRLLVLNHRRMLEDPLAAATSVGDFLQLPLDVKAMAATVNPGLYRQRSG
jgi:hypothetical protein